MSSDMVKAILLPADRACTACLGAGQRACLKQSPAGDVLWSEYNCCSPNSLAKPCWGDSLADGEQGAFKYCSTEITEPKKSFVPVVDQSLREWTCPINAANCDGDVEIKVKSADTYESRQKSWEFEVPTLAATNWFCKYRVSLDPASGLVAKDNFLMVQVESYGFDETLTVMSQPSDATKIIDWKSNTDANGVRVYQAGFSQKFFFPADNDVLITYAPIRNKPGPQQDVKSYMGRIKLRAIYVNANVVDGAPRLTDADSRDAKTVVDEKFRFYKIVDPCLAKDTSDVCIADTGCAWDDATKCAAKVIAGDTCPNHNLKPVDCKADNTCFYELGRCAKKTGCAALLTAADCGGDATCLWDTTAKECGVKPPPACSTLKNDTCTVGRDDCEWYASQGKCDSKAKECE